MALIHFDNFASYSSDSEGLNVFSEFVIGSAQLDGRGGGKAVSLTSGSGSSIRYTLSSGEEHEWVYSGFATIFNEYASRQVIKFGSNSLTGNVNSQGHVMLWIVPSSGDISVTRGNSTVLGSAVYPVTQGAFHFIEMGAKLHNSAGAVIIKIDGNTVINVSGVNTRQSGSDTKFKHVSLRGSTPAVTDWYICNGGGASFNTFLGDVTVKNLSPNDNGSHADLTGSDSDKVNNFQLVNSKLIYNSTSQSSFVQSDNVGDLDTYEFENISGVDSVLAARVTGMIGKTDAGARTAGIVVRSGGADYVSSDITPGVGVGRFALTYETDPDTGLPWDETGINSAEFGVKVKA